MVGRGCGVYGEEVRCRLVWGIFGVICRDLGERCSIMVSVVRCRLVYGMPFEQELGACMQMSCGCCFFLLASNLTDLACVHAWQGSCYV